jgi:Icc-related predicted phosphoesterase
MPKSLSIVFISDTHGKHWDINIPYGDILIHGGDLTKKGMVDDVRDFDSFLGTLPHPHKIVIAGNHDFCFQREPLKARAALTNAIYLEDQAVEILGLNFYGSPWQPWFNNWAFNLRHGSELKEKWSRIPEETDILITHGPPYKRCDQTLAGDNVGCKELLAAIDRIRPAYHLFGHIHEAHGTDNNEHTTFMNASICDYNYHPSNKAMTFIVEKS